MLFDQIEKDFLESYKAKNEVKSNTLRLVKSALKNAAIDKKSDLNDEEVTKIIKREIKQRQDAIVEFERGGRSDLSDKEKNEIAILAIYLPEDLSETEIIKLVKETKKDLCISDPSQTGRLIGAVMAKTKGRADGARVSELVRKSFS